MKKIKKYIIPVIALLFFIAIMNSGELLKKPFGNNDNVLKYVEIMRKDVTNEKWKQAASDLQKLKTAWTIVKQRIQFSVERNEMNLMDTNISRLEGALSINDKSFIIIELKEFSGHWNELEE